MTKLIPETAFFDIKEVINILNDIDLFDRSDDIATFCTVSGILRDHTAPRARVEEIIRSLPTPASLANLANLPHQEQLATPGAPAWIEKKIKEAIQDIEEFQALPDEVAKIKVNETTPLSAMDMFFITGEK